MTQASSKLRLVVTMEVPIEAEVSATSAGELTNQVVSLERSRITIGRRPYNDLVLDHITVSGEHAILERKGTTYEFVDIGSSNGSYVNRLRVTRKKLSVGDSIGIGVYQLRLVGESTLSTVILDRPSTVAQISNPDTTDVLKAKIEYLSGPLKGITQQIDRSLLKIGRGQHVAVVGKRKGEYYLTHLEGLVPTQLNGEAFAIGARPLRDGDLIKLGETELRFLAR